MNYRNIGVIGLGIAGTSIVHYLAQSGARVHAFDRRVDLDTTALVQAGIAVYLGPIFNTDVLYHLDALVLSPGIDPQQQYIQDCVARGIPLLGELDLWHGVDCKTVGITGTNGKSTTTMLIGALCEHMGQATFVGGNIGTPMLDYKINQQHADIAVLELSSYQLEYGVDIAFDVGIVLNVTPDHMDRYRNMQHYADTKAHLVACCKKAVVLNADDAWVRNMAHVVPNNVAIYWFSQHAHDRDGVALTANDHMQMQGCLRDLYADIPLAHNKLLGVHNRDNAMSAFLAMHALGVMHDTATWLRGYQQFTGLPHRLQIVADVDGVCYINDSKATNDAAAAIAVQAMQRPFIWLLGGQDKGSGYQACLQAAAHRPLKTIIAFGAARNIIASACAEFGLSCMVCDTMLEACHAAQQLACANDVVLLSPACASFDEFMNYNHRGQVYTKWAQQQT